MRVPGFLGHHQSEAGPKDSGKGFIEFRHLDIGSPFLAAWYAVRRKKRCAPAQNLLVILHASDQNVLMLFCHTEKIIFLALEEFRFRMSP